MNGTASRQEWQVPADHPVFAGHFPGTPILPGVVLLDVVISTLAAAGVAIDRFEIRSAKFLAPARPGDRLQIGHTLCGSGKISFDILCGTRKIAAGELIDHTGKTSATS